MHKKYHILNGDALREHFPEQIEGEVLIMRECLVDGDVRCRDLEDLFKVRGSFISNNYGECSENEYYQKCTSEFKKMQSIPEGSEINLWFEDDLFCQVNLWFVINLLNNGEKDYLINLVRPTVGHEYCFAEMTETELLTAYANKAEMSSSDIQKFCELWKLYQDNNCKEMIQIAEELNQTYPFLMAVCEAHAARFPLNGSPGRPEQSIVRIMEELQTNDFTLVFREFCKRESIYGLGDLQVKRLYKTVINNT